MFLKPKRRLYDWIVSPVISRLVDAAPAPVALCDRDRQLVASSALLRDSGAWPAIADWLQGLDLSDGGGPSVTALQGQSLRLPGQDCVSALLAPLTEETGELAGYWVRLDQGTVPQTMAVAPAMALDPAQAYATVDRDGLIRSASQPFHDLVRQAAGSLDHRPFRQVFANPADADDVLARLARGADASGDYAMSTPSGRESWASLQFLRFADAAADHAVMAVLARDITQRHVTAANDAAVLKALSRSQAVIEFLPDGTILTANRNFLTALDYTDVAEVQGRHHRIFVFREDQEKPEYGAFWRKLASGQFFTGRFRRATRTGREIWIEASYNPVFGANGTVEKIIKFAVDCTAQMQVSRKVSSSIGMVEAVASGSEQMADSIREISKTMQTSREAVDAISQSIEDSVKLAEDMTQGAQSMERVIGLIKHIAGTVNLLALNATIEAARAGSAGKSFAVVALEVKNLAAQTNEAIGEIEKEVKAMQSVSQELRRNVEGISTSAAKVAASVGTVAAAMTEQTGATSDISRNIAVIAGAVSDLGVLVSS